MLVDYWGSNFWWQSFIRVISLAFPPTFIQFLSDHCIETITVAIVTTGSTFLSYHSLYASDKPIIRLAKLNTTFCITGICLLLINTIIAVFSYLIIIFIFQELDKIAGLKWVQTIIAACFGILIGSSIKQIKSSDDKNLLQLINQTLDPFDLRIFPFIEKLILSTLKGLKELQNIVISNLYREIRDEKSRLETRIINVLDRCSLDNIRFERYIARKINHYPSTDEQEKYRHKLSEINSLFNSDKRSRQSWLIVEICSHNEIEELIKEGCISQIIKEIRQINLD